MPFSVIAVGVDHRDLNAVYQPDGVNARLPIIETVINSLHRRALEDKSGVLESQAVTPDIDAVLLRVPGEAHLNYIYEMSLHKSSDTPPAALATSSQNVASS